MVKLSCQGFFLCLSLPNLYTGIDSVPLSSTADFVKHMIQSANNYPSPLRIADVENPLTSDYLS